MVRRGAATLCASCLAMLTVSSPALGASLPGPPASFFLAHFKASIKGEETITWTEHHTANPSADRCDTADITGSGSQTFKFTSTGTRSLQVIGEGGAKAGFLPRPTGPAPNFCA